MSSATPQRVSSTEVARSVARAFGSGAVHRDTLIGMARASGARDEVLVLLQRLPSYRFTNVRQVLEQLPRNLG